MSNATYVELLLQSMQGVPNDINRHLNLIHKLDSDVEELRKNIAESRRLITNACNKYTEISPEIVREVSQNLIRLQHNEKQVWILSQEKIAVVEDAKRIIANFIVKTDNDTLRLRNTLQLQSQADIDHLEHPVGDRFTRHMSDIFPNLTTSSQHYLEVLQHQENIENNPPQFPSNAKTFNQHGIYHISWPLASSASAGINENVPNAVTAPPAAAAQPAPIPTDISNTQRVSGAVGTGYSNNNAGPGMATMNHTIQNGLVHGNAPGTATTLQKHENEQIMQQQQQRQQQQQQQQQLSHVQSTQQMQHHQPHQPRQSFQPQQQQQQPQQPQKHVLSTSVPSSSSSTAAVASAVSSSISPPTPSAATGPASAAATPVSLQRGRSRRGTSSTAAPSAKYARKTPLTTTPTGSFSDTSGSSATALPPAHAHQSSSLKVIREAHQVPTLTNKTCPCKQTLSDEEMIGCDNKECPVEWYHLSCVGLQRAPTGTEWFCSDGCRNAHERAMREGRN